MFKQACLIKKNTKTLRKKIEELGYKYVDAVKSTNPYYDNMKEPWILCIYDSYVLLDKETFDEFKESFEITEKPESLSKDIKVFHRQKEEEFLMEVSIPAEVN